MTKSVSEKFSASMNRIDFVAKYCAENRMTKILTEKNYIQQQLFWASWSLVELSFRIKFSLSGKISGYELPAISKQHNVTGNLIPKLRRKKE